MSCDEIDVVLSELVYSDENTGCHLRVDRVDALSEWIGEKALASCVEANDLRGRKVCVVASNAWYLSLSIRSKEKETCTLTFVHTPISGRRERGEKGTMTAVQDIVMDV